MEPTGLKEAIALAKNGDVEGCINHIRDCPRGRDEKDETVRAVAEVFAERGNFSSMVEVVGLIGNVRDYYDWLSMKNDEFSNLALVLVRHGFYDKAERSMKELEYTWDKTTGADVLPKDLRDRYYTSFVEELIEKGEYSRAQKYLFDVSPECRDMLKGRITAELKGADNKTPTIDELLASIRLPYDILCEFIDEYAEKRALQEIGLTGDSTGEQSLKKSYIAGFKDLALPTKISLLKEYIILLPDEVDRKRDFEKAIRHLYDLYSS